MGMPVDGHHTREALEICVAHGWKARESIARCNLGNFAFFAGRWHEAVEDYRSQPAGRPRGGQRLRGGRDRREPRRGAGQPRPGRRGRAVLRDAVRVLRASGVEWMASYAEMQLARVEPGPRRPRPGGGGDRASRGRGSPRWAPGMTAFEATLVRAEIATSAGEPARALALLDEGEAAAKGDAAPLRARRASRGPPRCWRWTTWTSARRWSTRAWRPPASRTWPTRRPCCSRWPRRLAIVRGDVDAAADLAADADRLLARLGVQGADRQALVDYPRKMTSPSR